MTGYEHSLRRLEDALVQQGRTCIDTFATSEANKQVYAFSIEFDAVNDSGRICWNTIGALERTLARDCYKDYSPSKINAFDGVKYNTGDFEFTDDGCGQWYEEFRAQIEGKSEEYQARADDDRRSTLIRAVERLRPDFTQFDLTPDFVAYVSDWQRWRSEWPATMRATIPDRLFNQLFPSFEEVGKTMRRIGVQSDREQAEFWVREFEAYYNGRPTPFNEHVENSAQQFGEMAGGALENLNPSALPITLDAFERSLLDGRNRNARCPFPADRLDYSLAVALEKMCGDGGSVEEPDVHRVHRCLQTVFDRAYGTDKAGFSLQCAASVLHAFRPNKYPKPECDSERRLQNWQEYGLKTPDRGKTTQE